MSKHPTRTELEAFLGGGLPKDRIREVSRHLLKGCPSCRALLLPDYEMLELAAAEPVQQEAIHSQVPELAAAEPMEQEATYDRVLDALFQKIRSHGRYLRREHARAQKIGSLLERGRGLKGLLEETDEPLRDLGAFKALLNRSRAVRRDDPREMANLARAAVEARNLDPRRFGPRLLADIQTWAWGELGNALRVGDDLNEADRAFGTAFELLLEGTGDPYVKARLYDLHASLLGTRRQFDLAFTALDLVHADYLDLGERHLAGRALIKKAMYVFYNGQPEEAMRINQEGIALIDPNQDPSLPGLARYNHLAFLVACGRFREAKRSLFDHRVGLNEFSRCAVDELKVRWLQGQVSAGLGEGESAELAFNEVREGFEKLGMGFASALASLELALLWMKQHRNSEAEKLALETVEVFVALRVHREAFGALMILQDALKKQTATTGLLEEVVEFLRRLFSNPDARFVPSGR